MRLPTANACRQINYYLRHEAISMFAKAYCEAVNASDVDALAKKIGEPTAQPR